MNALARLLDRQAIEEVLARYCRGVDRCDVDTLASCSHSDGTDDHGTFVGNGQGFAAWATAGAAKVWAASDPSKRSALVNPTRTRDMCPVFGTHRGRLDV